MVTAWLRPTNICSRGWGRNAKRDSARRQLKLPQRVPAVDQQPTARHERAANPLKCELGEFRMTTVEGAYTDAEREIKRFFIRQELEILNRDVANAHLAGADLIGGASSGLLDAFGGAINHQDVPIADAFCDRPRGSAGASANLKDPHPRLQWQGIYDRS